MPLTYCYNHPRPAVTVDVVVFSREGTERHLSVLLVRRKHEPFAGKWSLPGGYLDIDEPIEEGARRELREETGLDFQGALGLVGVFGDPGRDPRGRTISIAHGAVWHGPAPEPTASDDAEEARWFNTAEVEHLAFDHDLILTEALNWLQTTWQ